MTVVICAFIKTFIKIGEFLCRHFNIEDGRKYTYQRISLYYFKKGKNATERQKKKDLQCMEKVL